ncbi:hypothetical protein TVAG_441620 [Trichomonas vaginalis G3]|uniref:Uncharacterized protein n=1 Tax=Trichomonas vaginalis (strain ATCC PRA-98 / G3) TaxID=412133 RepID=A2FL87_TRIV3|nr:spectrin binding [Trichomonas vaginalis G3]EAX94343.1 hypothetical protein TVAG_441620 [Trichomonas vaginalis G3]KAI5521825.1 spectrin binding [Trichomonas vaginalis G3]|eukprot:XP_001307273.1 hypothetical protein [Trichomonas vaginalis G3]
MKSVQKHISLIANAAFEEEDTSKFESTISDMIFCFLDEPTFYKLPIEIVSRCIKNSNENFTEKNVQFILANLSNAVNKDATKLIDPIKPCSSEQLAEAVSKVTSCSQLPAPIQIPESGFIQTQPPKPLEIYRQYDRACIEHARNRYANDIKEIMKIIEQSKQEATIGPENLAAEQEKAKKELEDQKAHYQDEEDQFQKKVDALQQRYDELLTKFDETPKQREYFLEYMSQQHEFLEERAKLEKKLNVEIAPIKSEVEGLVKKIQLQKDTERLLEEAEKHRHQNESNSKKQKKGKEQPKHEEPSKHNKPQGKPADDQEEMMKDLEEQEEDITKPLAIPENPTPVRAINKPKAAPLPTKITSIFDAILLHDVAEVQKFIQKKKSVVNERGKNRITPFTTAALENDLEIMKILFENGADPNIADGSGRTAFHIAASKDSKDMIQFLADIKANSTIKDKEGRKPVDIVREREIAHNTMQEACKNNDVRKLGEVLRKWPDMVSVKFRGGIAPLHLASGFDSSKICQKLLQWGADINALDDNGNTPLHYAVEYEAPHTARYLLRSAANATIKNKDGKLPLEMEEPQ